MRPSLARLALVIARPLLAPAAPLLRWIDARRPAVYVEGVAVVVHPDAGPPGPAVARLRDALALLAAVSPRRLQRLRADVRRLLIEPWSGTAGYSRRSRAILLDPSHLREASSAWVASALVHEATHARLSSARGVRVSARNLARVERRCCAEQIDFLRRLPPAYAPEAERAVAWIEQCLAAEGPWYAAEVRDAALAAHFRDAPPAGSGQPRVEEDRARGV